MKLRTTALTAALLSLAALPFTVQAQGMDHGAQTDRHGAMGPGATWDQRQDELAAPPPPAPDLAAPDQLGPPEQAYREQPRDDEELAAIPFPLSPDLAPPDQSGSPLYLGGEPLDEVYTDPDQAVTARPDWPEDVAAAEAERDFDTAPPDLGRPDNRF